MQVKLGSAAHVEVANIGYGIGLDEDGHVVEFEADWEKLRTAPVGEFLEIEDWQVRTVDEELRVDLSRGAMATRAAFIRQALRR